MSVIDKERFVRKKMLLFIQVITTQNAIFDANCQLKRQLPTVRINCVIQPFLTIASHDFKNSCSP